MFFSDLRSLHVSWYQRYISVFRYIYICIFICISLGSQLVYIDSVCPDSCHLKNFLALCPLNSTNVYQIFWRFFRDFFICFHFIIVGYLFRVSFILFCFILYSWLKICAVLIYKNSMQFPDRYGMQYNALKNERGCFFYIVREICNICKMRHTV